MDNNLSIEQLIKEAKKQKIDFGKGDPYNRLRYYTKMGWLPHMTRQKNKKGDITGHYPNWVLDRLVLIEQLKSQGLSNSDVERKIKEKNNIRTFREVLITAKNKERAIMGGIILTLLCLIIVEATIYQPRKNTENKDSEIQSERISTTEKGTIIIPKGQRSTVVEVPNVRNIEDIMISFNQDYSPATNFWVTTRANEDGFIIETNKELLNDTTVTWWVIK